MKQLAFQQHINGLRAIAVAIVVLFHLQIEAVPGGFVGVDVFFVISGYLMTRILVDGFAKPGFSIPRFWLNRLARVMPALLAMSLAILAAGGALLLPVPYVRLATEALWANGFAINYHFAHVTGYFSPAAEHSWFLHCWSLAVEFQFYVLLPLLLWLANRIGGRRAILATLAFGAVASASFSYIETSRSTAPAFYLLPSRFWEFAIGGLLVFFPALPRFKLAVALIGLALIAYATLVFTRFYAYPGLWPVLPVIGAALVVWAAPARSPLNAGPMQFLGAISYSLYLWHWPVIMAAKYLGVIDPIPLIAATVPTMLALSWLSFRFIETPARDAFKGRRTLAPLWVAAIPIAAVLGVSAWVIQMNGMPKRIPKQYAAVIQTAQYGNDYREGACFLRPGQGFRDLAPGCLVNDETEKPKLLLWGDSHAAHLYPGLASQSWAKNYAIEQITASACRPFIEKNAARPLCEETNKSARAFITASRPEIVIVAANGLVPYGFPGKDYNLQFELMAKSQLQEVVDFLKGAGVRHVLVVGPIPAWDVPLPEAYYRQRFRRGEDRLSPNEPSRLGAIDSRLKQYISGLGAAYISIVDTICKDLQCKVEHQGKLMQFDTEHLTTAGSQYLASSALGPALMGAR